VEHGDQDAPLRRGASDDLGHATVRGSLVGVAAALTVATLVVSRRPDGLLRPQFWAEDGNVWYAQAHNKGALEALLTPWTGYVQTFSRLTAALSLAFDLRQAPLVFEVAAVVAQSLAPLLLLSRRFAGILPDMRLRALAALLLIGLPNSFEIQSNVTNAQTHLALLALLIVLADPPPSRAWKVFDVFFVLLGGLSGPTCVLLVPVAALTWLMRRERWARTILLVLLVPASVQAITYLRTGRGARFTTPLGAGVVRLLQILGGQVFLAGALGVRLYGRVMAHPTVADVATVLLGVAGLAFVARALLLTRSFALRMFVLFAALALTAALLNPVIDPAPRWLSLRSPGAGSRYYAPASLAFLAALLWSACVDPSARWRTGSRALLLGVLLVGIPTDWHVAPRIDLDFPAEAARYAAAPRRSWVRIPIPPDGWVMNLRKRRH
jgi:hypothetical protein